MRKKKIHGASLLSVPRGPRHYCATLAAWRAARGALARVRAREGSRWCLPLVGPRRALADGVNGVAPAGEHVRATRIHRWAR